MQRGGRAARAPNLTGIFIILVEPSAFTRDIVAWANIEAAKGSGVKGAKGAKAAKPKALSAAFAAAHGRLRGSADKSVDDIEYLEDFDMSSLERLLLADKTSEGLYVMVQCTACRLVVPNRVYQNPAAGGTLQYPYKIHASLTCLKAPQVPCCDICHPELLDLVRADTRQRGTRVPQVPKREPNKKIRDALYDWRRLVHKRDFPRAVFTASSFLPTDAIDLIAKLTPSADIIKQHMHIRWRWWDEYGTSLTEAVLQAAGVATQAPSATAAQAEERPRTDSHPAGNAPLRSNDGNNRVVEQSAPADTRNSSHIPSPSGVVPQAPAAPSFPLSLATPLGADLAFGEGVLATSTPVVNALHGITATPLPDTPSTPLFHAGPSSMGAVRPPATPCPVPTASVSATLLTTLARVGTAAASGAGRPSIAGKRKRVIGPIEKNDLGAPKKKKKTVPKKADSGTTKQPEGDPINGTKFIFYSPKT